MKKKTRLERLQAIQNKITAHLESVTDRMTAVQLLIDECNKAFRPTVLKAQGELAQVGNLPHSYVSYLYFLRKSMFPATISGDFKAWCDNHEHVEAFITPKTLAEDISTFEKYFVAYNKREEYEAELSNLQQIKYTLDDRLVSLKRAIVLEASGATGTIAEADKELES